MESSLFDVTAFYSELESKQSAQPRSENDNAPRLKKIFLNAPPNIGSITILPFQDPVSKLFYTYFDKDTEKVKELKVWNEQQGDDKWHKILPKNLLGQLSAEDEALYNEVSSMWKFIKDEEKADFRSIKDKAYTLVYGYVISHFNKDNKVVEGSAGQMALIVIPSPMFAYKQRTNIDQVKAQAGGSIEWLSSILNNKLEGRNAYLKIGFLNAANGAIGYDLSVSYEFNNPHSPVGMVVPADLKLEDSSLKLFEKGHVADFMGWQSGEHGLFNRQLYLNMRERLNELNGVTTVSSESSSTTTGNPVDSVVSTPAPVTAEIGNINPLANIPGVPVAPPTPVETPVAPPTPPIPGFPVPGVQ